MARVFPYGFLWGSAISAHQSEGNNTNSDWWEHELAPGTTAVDPSGRACDSYRRFSEDWRLVADSGQNAVRFSIEWARIEPSPGVFSTAELDHYREVIGTARDLGLTTFVTLHHFTNPIWFARRGGWTADDAVQLFTRYAAKVVDALGDLLHVVNTINEPQIVAAVGHAMGYFPPRMTDLAVAHRVTANLIKAHAVTSHTVKEKTSAQVGIPLSVMDFVPASESEEDQEFCRLVHHFMVGVYLEALRTGWIRGLMTPDEEAHGLVGSDDFVGVQYYTRIAVRPGPLGPAGALISAPQPGKRVTQMGWVWHPPGLGRVLDEVATTGLPVHITENGIATENDEERIEYVRLHLEQVHEAISRGVDVRGYFYWSILDNFEWNEGYRPKFGLVAVDRQTMERRPKPSLSWYGGIARANRLDER
jgi:beta-glucosidase